MKKENILVEAIKSTNNLYCTTGIENGYRRAFLDGLGGSRKEKTWDRKLKQHDCCKSAVSWRHKVSCPGLKDNNEEVEVSETKEELLEKYFN